MSAIPYSLDPLGASGNSPYFEVVVKPGILGDSLTYGFTPYWNTGGYCKVVDWGDGSSKDATASGTKLTHTYAVAGTYTIRIKADCDSCMFGYGTYAPLIYNANGNWDALGNITNGVNMFSDCNNATLPLTSLPAGLTNGSHMFDGCNSATLPLTSLPAGLTNVYQMFKGCTNATLPLTQLPDGITKGVNMFSDCNNATLPLTSLPAGLTDGYQMFKGCTKATLPLTSLPAGLTSGQHMFNDCTNATLPLTSLPAGLTNVQFMFNGCTKATLHLTRLPDGIFGNLTSVFSNAPLTVINLDDLTANAPEGGWTKVTSIENMLYNAGSGNSPGTVTGSRSAFLAKFPKVINTTNAFYGTNTTE